MSGKKWMSGLIVAGVVVAATHVISAPSKEDPKITALTKEIDVSPKDAELYVERGELYRARRDWDRAAADFQKARELDPKHRRARLCEARVLLDRREPREAIAQLDRFLEEHNGHATALELRARAWSQLKDRPKAINDYAQALRNTGSASKELFLGYAQVLVKSGKVDKALRILDRGIKELGPERSLQEMAINLEVRRTLYDAALARLDRAAAADTRKEFWWLRRGEILEKAGRPSQAQATYARALKWLHALPDSQRYAPETQRLESRLKWRLERVGRKSTNNTRSR